MNENQLTVVKEYKFDNPLITKTDSIIDNCIRDCHYKYFHTIYHICEYDLNFKNITTNGTVNFTISDRSMGMYELNKKLAFVRGNGFIFNQIKKFELKIYSNLSSINIHYHLRLGSPPLHRQFFIKYLEIMIIFKHNGMTVEIHSILHVVNGIYIIIHNVILYNYTNSNTNTCKNKYNFTYSNTIYFSFSKNITQICNFFTNFCVISCVSFCVPLSVTLCYFV